MSEHRRKQPPSRGRRASQPPAAGRRVAPPSGATTSSYGAPAAGPAGGRAEARRAQRGSRRAATASESAAGEASRAGRGRRSEDPPKKRFIDYPRSTKEGARRWLPSWRQIAALCVTGLGLLVGLTGVALALVEPPNENDAAKAQNNVYYWSDSTVMARDGQTNRQNVDISNIPSSMQDAVIAAENATFREDSGVDPRGIARAVVNMARGQDTQGGSTITQQFVKNNYLSQDQTVTRKAKELFISIKVGSTMKKEKIMQGYLNTSYYGRGAYGIQAAAQAYYGKDAKELKPDESALLTTVLKGADLYDPAGGEGPNSSPQQNRARAEKRWAWVLDRQAELGLMEQSERDKYRKFPEPIERRDQNSKTGQVGYLMAVAKAEVLRKTSIERKQLDRGGYQIHTTFDRKKVEQMEKSVNKVREANLKPDEREVDNFVQFGAASVEPGTGKIVALYGGEGFDKGHYTNNANTFGVPVGSVWKPFVLAAAMEHGTHKSSGQGISPDSKYDGDNKIAIKNQDGSEFLDDKDEVFRQVNMNDKDWGPITLRKAMEVSANTPFVQLGMDVGMEKVRDTAREVGIKEESMDGNLNPSFALGTSTPSAIRMADAYATFAASGSQAEPFAVTRVVLKGNDTPGFEKPKRKTAIDPNVANNVTEVLEGVITGEEGTGAGARSLGRPAAGKTGTTDGNKSAWWVGYTPQLSTSVTMFRTDPESKELKSMRGVGGFPSIAGGKLPTEVWTTYMKAALKGEPAKAFPKAQPISNLVNSDAIPSPTPTPSETAEEPEETEEPEEPKETPSPSPSTEPSEEPSCEFWDVTCNNTGGQNQGQQNGGSDGQTGGEAEGQDAGTTDGQTGGTDTGQTTGGNQTGGGNTGGGGLFGGRGEANE
ncbi:transglycosylase domain-containing protein [Streptomyces sp. 549]|uniref:transglycosylase domain-containing protein n=1 Tax=Streptomyces sp. 549 TaxID=3049076 RepID=UPI0024C37DA5|nr:transglycosylase domain-containing protein [Streptomyces sp. 549]MDK1475030.1 transglycosylase domain-containing protein [Streptomyces sp. 549]